MKFKLFYNILLYKRPLSRFLGGGGKLYKNMHAGVQQLARKHTCDLDMRRAYAIGVLDSTEDTLKVLMYWLKVQGLRVKAFVVCCLLLVV